MTKNKRLKIINEIQKTLEENSLNLSEWEVGFLEDIQERLIQELDLSTKQYNKLTDIIGFKFLD